MLLYSIVAFILSPRSDFVPLNQNLGPHVVGERVYIGDPASGATMADIGWIAASDGDGVIIMGDRGETPIYMTRAELRRNLNNFSIRRSSD